MGGTELGDFIEIDSTGNKYAFVDQKPTIRILLYTDDDLVRDDDDSEFGIGRLKKLLGTPQPAFATIVPPDLKNRNEGGHAFIKLKRKGLLDDYDEIWLFGLHQTNKQNISSGLSGGGPHSEPDDTEIAELKSWMAYGGLLLTGDHSNPDPRNFGSGGPSEFCPGGVDHSTFLGLGRALGHQVPRAGQLRKWKGPPTSCPADSHNTLTSVGSGDLDDPRDTLQSDSVPQQLLLPRFNSLGQPDSLGQPHSLFLNRNGDPIQVFPDHLHEGEVTIPSEFGKDWPLGNAGARPKPMPVAFGLDKRFAVPCREYVLVAAYDGDSAITPTTAGRIVADSTWHHYFNTNLVGFFKDPTAAPVLDQIGQYYRNLAVWLAPERKRKAMARSMLVWLATHPVLAEEAGSGVLEIGRAAETVLARFSGACEVRELLQICAPESLRVRGELLWFPNENSLLTSFPSQELVLGTIVGRLQRAINQFIDGDSSDQYRMRSVDELIKEGFAQAFRLHANRLARLSREAQEYLEAVAPPSG